MYVWTVHMSDGNRSGIRLFRIRMEALRDPCDSDALSIAIEPAIDCDGSECGVAFPDSEGELEDLQPHFHLKISGRQPDAGPEIYAVDGVLPKVID